MNSRNIFEHLRELEISLHSREVRANRDRLEELLHEAFYEFGRSGKRYSRSDILKQFQDQEKHMNIDSSEFSFEPINEDVILLTYKSAHIAPDGELSRHTLRSSIWQRTDHGWKLRFHQGTPEN